MAVIVAQDETLPTGEVYFPELRCRSLDIPMWQAGATLTVSLLPLYRCVTVAVTSFTKLPLISPL